MTTTASRKRSLRFRFASRQLMQEQLLHWSAKETTWRLRHSSLQLTDRTGLTTLMQQASLLQMPATKSTSKQKLTIHQSRETILTTCSSLPHNHQRKSKSPEMSCHCLLQNSASWSQLDLIASTIFSAIAITYLIVAAWLCLQLHLLTTATVACSTAAHPWLNLQNCLQLHLQTSATTACSMAAHPWHKLQNCLQLHLQTAVTAACSMAAYPWLKLQNCQQLHLLTTATTACSSSALYWLNLQHCLQLRLLTTAIATCSTAAHPWHKHQL